jgi:hypothetical protein
MIPAPKRGAKGYTVAMVTAEVLDEAVRLVVSGIGAIRVAKGGDSAGTSLGE